MKSVLRKGWEGWKAFARIIGNFNSRLILTLFYFLVVGISSLLIGRWQNTLRRHPPSQSNWLPVSSKETDLSNTRRQF
ncbi:MAG: hypothetical protein HY590_03270 [Candidatus Omnitrophica bacterium]|nr:hypothetical protein [Candidatus Omnitrophota bacterium]